MNDLFRRVTQRFPSAEHVFRVFAHEDCLLHQVPDVHPEKVERLLAILSGCLALPDSVPLSMHIASVASISDLEAVHSRSYLLSLEEACLRGANHFMGHDNPVVSDTFRAVLAAAGTAIALGRHVRDGGSGFALVRPPGHHAGARLAEGFCYANNVALAVETIRAKDEKARTLIVDFDVHHGNGIHDIFAEDDCVFYFSLHGSPAHIYPGTGHAWEKGTGKGLGLTRNVTLSIGCEGQQWLESLCQNLKECVSEWRPDFMLVSAGFDAHWEDPFGLMHVEDKHYRHAVTALCDVARESCSDRIGFFLEGGYSLAVLERLVPTIFQDLALRFNGDVRWS
jgi:acetoin utilization deacetylase AcuC-like enzyme